MSLRDIIENISLLNNEAIYRVIVFVSIIVVGIAISIIVRRTFLKFLSARTSKAIASNVSRAIYYVLLFTVFVVALGAIGIDVTGFVLAGGFAGIVIGVALQPLLSNLFAGLYLMIEKTISVGEIVEVANNAGEVTEVSPIFTRIRTFDGIIISVANTQIISGITKNFSKAVARRIEFKLSISYKEDAEKAYRVIKNVLDEHPYVLVNPSPDIFVSNLEQSGVAITVRVWTPPQVAYDTMTFYSLMGVSVIWRSFFSHLEWVFLSFLLPYGSFFVHELIHLCNKPPIVHAFYSLMGVSGGIYLSKPSRVFFSISFLLPYGSFRG